MRTLCAVDTIFWQPAPVQDTLAGIPYSILNAIIKDVFESEVVPKLDGHSCDTASPCVVLRRAMRICVRLLSVCKTWNSLASRILKTSQHSSLLSSSQESKCAYDPFIMALDFSLGGRYRAYEAIEQGYDKSVVWAYDYGGPDGCEGKTRVVVKISSRDKEHTREHNAYMSFATAELDGRNIPHMHFEGRYGNSRFYGIVLDGLGPDLDQLRIKCYQERFTPKMTLAVAIQTIRIYEKMHAQGWLHTNAKAANFAIGPDLPGKAAQIFVFDFEWSHRLEPMPKRNVELVGWNPLFRSVTWELGLTPSRRDDLEGLGYVFSYLERGSHPWLHDGDSLALWRLKIATPSKKLFEGMDPVYVRYFDEIKTLAWGEIPDYDGIVQRFVDVWERKGYGGIPGEIDWWDTFGLKKIQLYLNVLRGGYRGQSMLLLHVDISHLFDLDNHRLRNRLCSR